jgi:hypothetical protein
MQMYRQFRVAGQPSSAGFSFKPLTFHLLCPVLTVLSSALLTLGTF